MLNCFFMTMILTIWLLFHCSLMQTFNRRTLFHFIYIFNHKKLTGATENISNVRYCRILLFFYRNLRFFVYDFSFHRSIEALTKQIYFMKLGILESDFLWPKNSYLLCIVNVLEFICYHYLIHNFDSPKWKKTNWFYRTRFNV